MFSPAILALTCVCLSAQSPDPFAPIRFLVGEWEGESGGDSGQGAFSFKLELDGAAMVRKNWAAFPAQKGKPASRHEDLMTIYSEGGLLKALYLDNEGHVIHYKVTGDGGEGLVFRSENQPGPAFRLTYRPKGPDTVRVIFAIAPPGTEAFTPYVEGTCRRKGTTVRGQN